MWMDVGVWLRSLGLGQYEAAFRDNEIDGEVLPNLTAEDLKDLGVAIVGHRRNLLLAIGALSAAPAAPPAAGVAKGEGLIATAVVGHDSGHGDAEACVIGDG